MSSINTIINGSVISINFRNFSSDSMGLAFSQALAQYRDQNNPVYSNQRARVYMGNPGDVNYQDRPFDCLYLGTTGNAFGEPCHFWYCPELMLIAVTFAGDPGRSTWARHIGDGPMETRVSEEQMLLLNTAFAEAQEHLASLDMQRSYHNAQHA